MSTLTATFTSLPLEVRNEIYEYLFHKPTCEPPQHHQISAERTEKDGLGDVPDATERLAANVVQEYVPRQIPQALAASEGLREVREDEFIANLLPYRSLSGSSAILRTCRQLYHEAVPFLYANKVFERHSLQMSQVLSWKYKICDFSDQSLHRIRQCTIVVGSILSLETIMDSIAYFANDKCTLKRLGVTFNFHSRCLPHFDNYPKMRYHEWMLAISQCSKIVKSIAAVQVLENIDIVVTENWNGYDNTPGDIFEPFVEAVATAKGWSCTERVYESTTRDEMRHSIGEKNEEWIWHWQLRPPFNKPA